jgi:competence protein ComGC
VISLLIINILLLYFLRPINTKGDDAKGKNKTENVVIQKKVEQTKPNQTISNEEAKKRQEELIKAGYKVSADGIWGAQSEKTWNEYQQKKKGQK